MTGVKLSNNKRKIEKDQFELMLSKSLKSSPASRSSSATSDKNSSRIVFNSSPDRFITNRIRPKLISGSEIKHKTPFPQLAAKIFPDVNSLVTMESSPSSQFLPCSSDAQKTALAIAPIPSTSTG